MHLVVPILVSSKIQKADLKSEIRTLETSHGPLVMSLSASKIEALTPQKAKDKSSVWFISGVQKTKSHKSTARGAWEAWPSPSARQPRPHLQRGDSGRSGQLRRRLRHQGGSGSVPHPQLHLLLGGSVASELRRPHQRQRGDLGQLRRRPRQQGGSDSELRPLLHLPLGGSAHLAPPSPQVAPPDRGFAPARDPGDSCGSCAP